MKKHMKKILGTVIGGFLGLGLLNAFIINHHSELSGQITYVKGLDEMYGVTQPGRILATNSKWKKVDSSNDSFASDSEQTQQDQGTPPSAIGEDLDLSLVEVVNPKLWSKGLPTSEFSGDLQTANGTIESLSVNLPSREEISISFAEMNGNVFQYDYAGEIYSGMLYQVDPKSFMVTLTNGPLEGTRLRFAEEFTPEQIELKDTLKKEHNIEIGLFGDEPEQKTNKKSINTDTQV